MTNRIICLLLSVLSVPLWASAQATPSISPLGTFTSATGEHSEATTSYSGSAPVQAHFEANTADDEGWNAYYEWRITLEGEKQPWLVRREKDTDITFTKAGTHYIQLYAIFTQGTDTVAYTDEYWKENNPLTITIAESKLEMPNAFSPNGDGINDIYKAKQGWQSIVEFHAYIFNRWGQKLYQWDNPDGGWDGKFHGKDVAQGVYFCLVKARGADGRHYNIKTDVNLLRGHTETSGSSGGQ